MDEDDVRIGRLERRVGELEQRIRHLEGVHVETPAPEQSAATRGSLVPPPPPVQLPESTWNPGPTVQQALPPLPRAAASRGALWGDPMPRAAAAPPAWNDRQAAALAPEPSAARPSISLRELEERFAGRAMLWVGGFALVAAAVFFLSLAFSRGWISEELRVVVGLIAGAAALAGGAVLFDRRNPMFGNVLVAVGLGIVSIALFAATRGYGLVAPEFGLAGALAAAIAAAVIAIRYDTREVAAFGLLAALAAPPVMGASPNMLTLLFVAVTLVGTTAIALFRTWPYLPPLAFILAAPQLASYLAGGVAPTEGLIALGGFWAVNIVAAAGEEMRIRRNDLRPSSATLVLANATFALWGGWVVLHGGAAQWLGTSIGVASLAHLALGAWFLRRQGLEHLFGDLVAGTGIALVAIAAFVQLGAPVVPLAWAAESTALAWLAVRRMHRWSAIAAVVLAMLAIAHILLVEYPLQSLGSEGFPLFATPWIHPEGASLGAVLLAMLVAAVVVPVRWIRSALAAIAVLLAGYGAFFEVKGPALVAAIVVLGLAGLTAEHVIYRLGSRTSMRNLDAWSKRWPYAASAALALGAAAVLLLVDVEYPAQMLGRGSETPFATPATFSLLVLLGGLVAAGRLIAVRVIRSGLAAVGVLVLAWALCCELAGLSLIGTIAVLLPLATVLDRGLGRLPESRQLTAAVTATLRVSLRVSQVATGAGALAWLVAVGIAASRYMPDMLGGLAGPPQLPFSDETALAAAAVIGAALAAARWTSATSGRGAALWAAICVAAVVVPMEVHADLGVPLWLGLAACSLILAGRGGRVGRVSAWSGWLIGATSVLASFTVVAPPERLFVEVYGAPPPLLPLWPVAFSAVAGACFLLARRTEPGRWRSMLEVGAAGSVVYLVSVAVVDVFQRMAGGTVALEELAKQAQVVMSVCWTALGASALAWGVSRRRVMARHIGFALLALATLKVFVVDLAAMDVAYRAVVLAGLGIVLMASAVVYTRLRSRGGGTGGLQGPGAPA